MNETNRKEEELEPYYFNAAVKRDCVAAGLDRINQVRNLSIHILCYTFPFVYNNMGFERDTYFICG